MAQTRAVGSIEVHEKLATGESGELYLGRQPGLDRMVVLRKLRADLLSNARVVDRFRRDARMGGRVSHPNVRAVFDLFASRGDHYMVLEHVDGPSLRDVLEQPFPIRTLIAARLALEIARGLAELHDRGIVHADVRPENVLISRWGEVKITGFGYAREVNEHEPPPLPTSNEYTAPAEGAAGAPAARGDVYAFGIVLRELLEGGESGFEPAPRLRVTRLQRLLHRLVAACTSERAARRPSAEDLCAQLEAALPRLSAPEIRTEIAAWLMARRRGTGEGPDLRAKPRLTPPPRVVRESAPSISSRNETEREAKPRIRVPETLRRWIKPAGGASAALLVAVGASWWLASLRSSDGTAALTPPVNAAPAPATASLRFAVHPWAKVRVDDGDPFVTPRAEPIEVEPGAHFVQLEHPTLGSVRKVMTLEPGSDTVVRHVFERKPRR